MREIVSLIPLEQLTNLSHIKYNVKQEVFAIL